MSVLLAWLRAAVYALWALPLAVGPVPPRLRVPRRLLGESVNPRRYSAPRAMWHSVLSAALGVVTWFFAFLAVLGGVRGLLYPLLTDGYENAWGGPTLAGAWSTHLLIGVVLVPVWLLVLAGLGTLQVHLTRAVLGRLGPRWPVAMVVLVCAAGVLLFLGWLAQV
ncbi:hypothetical protein ACIA8C_25385 [Nocardia sp. NPDC051321]|uniref:hypothetical protein n=1 Tax=Nocardia sp. NPDC051321 TaxID=3364323 RepID=UPI0037A205B1